jgi:hypothetical protein
MNKAHLFHALLLLSFVAPFDLQAQHLRRRTRLPDNLKEISGMTRLPNGDLWMLNDGGNTPQLFRFDPAQGAILETLTLPGPNRDWEDLNADPVGNLYIGDFGNNFNKRRDLCIFRYQPATGAFDSIMFSYPDQFDFPPQNEKDWNFDCEAMVFFGDSLHLFSKNRFKSDFITKHYVVPAQPGRYVAELRDSIRLKNRVVTGAALSRDGNTLALTAYRYGFRWGFLPFAKASVFYFTGFPGSRFFRVPLKKMRLPGFPIARQFESVLEWAPHCWMAANEGIGPQRPALWRIRH